MRRSPKRQRQSHAYRFQFDDLEVKRLLSTVGQVMIQATVVEVDLSNQYQAGIDWSAIDLKGTGLSLTSTLLGGAAGLAGPPITNSSFVLNYAKPTGDITAAISLL